jgi:hypothetical protein
MKWGILVMGSALFFTACAGATGGEKGGKPAVSPAGPKPVVVVFDVEAQRLELPESLLGALGDHLAALLTKSGRYQVVPRGDLKKRLIEKKKESYQQCYDRDCQIELGRELAAEKTLAAQVLKLGSECKVNLTLYDLKKAATEAAETETGGCDEDSIVGLLEKSVNKLVGGEAERKDETEAEAAW